MVLPRKTTRPAIAVCALAISLSGCAHCQRFAKSVGWMPVNGRVVAKSSPAEQFGSQPADRDSGYASAAASGVDYSAVTFGPDGNALHTRWITVEEPSGERFSIAVFQRQFMELEVGDSFGEPAIGKAMVARADSRPLGASPDPKSVQRLGLKTRRTFALAGGRGRIAPVVL